jgi:hypothetical protein
MVAAIAEYIIFRVMTKIKLLGLIIVSLILYACPFESTVPMAAKPIEPVDSSLLGYWYGIIKDGSDYFGIEALDISQQSDSVYSIIRYGKGIKGDIILPDTAYFTGYTSYIDNQRYMNIAGTVVLVETKNKKPVVTTQRVYYVSAINLSHDTLDVKTVTENFSTRKFFRNSDEFRQLVVEMLNRQKNIYDEQYSLKYRKIPKPSR